jgi:serine/threonine protein kinase/tetratricopeptide (TPR) repeat protein
MNEESLFAAAREKSDRAERQAFLAQACGDDLALRARLEQLLKADGLAGGILDGQPATIETAHAGPGLVPDRVIAGRFKLRQKLGEGGMGEVWAADQSEPIHRRVAIKLVRAGLDSTQLLARFEQERQALALMDHPNIAKVLDTGVDAAGRPYFVMELIKGKPITTYCDEAKLSPRERLQLFISVCDAVQHAHQKGIIHRDLKPSNILVGLYDDKPVPKVIDFGVAKAIGPRLTERSVYTEIGSLIGTLEYMSPEQAELINPDIDTRSDVYSLGVVLYELLTGSVPFSRKEVQVTDFTELLRIIKEVDPPGPSAKLSGSGTLPSVAAVRQMEPQRLIALVRGELDWIVMKAVAKDRTRRYETANGLARDIQRYLADEVVEARPPSAGYRLRKYVRRNKGLVRSLAALFLLLVAGIVGTSWGMVRAERNLRETEQARQAEAAERERAQTREAETRAVLDFVEKRVFATARPEKQKGGLGYKVTLRQAMEAALPFVAQSFHDQPLIEARLRMTIGISFRYLGDAKIAGDQFEAARRIFTKYLGDDHPDTLASMNNLANSYSDLGRHAEALKLREETLALKKAKLGADHPHTLKSMNNLANSYAALGRHAEALKLYEETLALRKAKLGADHPDTLESMHNLPNSYAALGRHAEALKLREETLALLKAKLGADHPDTLACMNNLATSYAALGRLTEALRVQEDTLALQKAKLGAGHPETLGSMYNVACFQALLVPKSVDRGKQADIAMEALQQAVAAGFNDPAQIKADTDLDALHGRDDFKKLVAELEAKAFERK